MKFYSGFSLKNEEHFFDELIRDSAYSVCGFSYGAIKACEHVKREIERGKRVDTLQLFSPAFFQTKSQKFKRLQSLSYAKSKDKYLLTFIEACFAPYEKQHIEQRVTSQEELDELLEYEWVLSDLKALEDKGVSIEVYLGGKDSIVDSVSAKEFFIEVATVTYIKDANHFLQIQ